MRYRWLAPAVISCALLGHVACAVAAERGCVVAKSRDSVDAFMQGLGAAGTFVLFVTPEGRWVKAAAAAGLATAIWNFAKSYYGSGGEPVICAESSPSGPSKLYLGQPSLVEPLYHQRALSTYLASPAGRQMGLQRPSGWLDLCSGPNAPSFCRGTPK